MDVTLTTDFGRAAKDAGVGHAVLLTGASTTGQSPGWPVSSPRLRPTAVGADPASTHSVLTGSAAAGGWYNHCKGVVEQNYIGLGFPSLAIFRCGEVLVPWVRPAGGPYPRGRHSPSTITGNPNTPGAWQWIARKIDGVLPARYKLIEAKVRNGLVGG